jgi:NADH-quinone oxidoreductase subunit K
MVPVSYYTILGAILFSIGVAGVLLRRNAIILFMSIADAERGEPDLRGLRP